MAGILEEFSSGSGCNTFQLHLKDYMTLKGFLVHIPYWDSNRIWYLASIFYGSYGAEREVRYSLILP